MRRQPRSRESSFLSETHRAEQCLGETWRAEGLNTPSSAIRRRRRSRPPQARLVTRRRFSNASPCNRKPRRAARRGGVAGRRAGSCPELQDIRIIGQRPSGCAAIESYGRSQYSERRVPPAEKQRVRRDLHAEGEGWDLLEYAGSYSNAR